MKIEQQVVSFDLAKTLKELGLKQASLFSYETYLIAEHNTVPTKIYCHQGHTQRIASERLYISNL